jgi:hypothetical protein
MQDRNRISAANVPDRTGAARRIGNRTARRAVAGTGRHCRGGIEMPAKSKAQQKAAGAALAAKRGEEKVSNLKGASKSMYKSMSEKELDDMASTKRKGKPEHASKR